MKSCLQLITPLLAAWMCNLPLISAQDKPAIWLNKRIMETYREPMRKFYYDPSKYGTYLEQLGITYPTIREGAATENKQ